MQRRRMRIVPLPVESVGERGLPAQKYSEWRIAVVAGREGWHGTAGPARSALFLPIGFPRRVREKIFLPPQEMVEIVSFVVVQLRRDREQGGKRTQRGRFQNQGAPEMVPDSRRGYNGTEG